MATSQPAQVVVHMDGVRSKPMHYKYPLLACCGNPFACFYVLCCPPCAAGEIYSGDCFGCSCCIGSCLCCSCFPFYPCIFTGPLRRRYNIMGNCCLDSCLFYFCCPCQMTRELRECRGI